MSSKLALGTVQFGLDYGVSNQTGKVPEDEARKILNTARERGVSLLDTAQAYGNAEQVLGRIGVAAFDVVSKVGRINVAPEAIEAHLRAGVKASLKHLGTDALHGLLLHDPDQIEQDQVYGAAIVAALRALKREGLVGKIGISVYGPEQTLRILQVFTPDIVQLPMCPLDRRWEAQNTLASIRDAGAEIHVRSVYLQGLLLMRPDDLPRWATPWRDLIADWAAWAHRQGITPAQAAISLTLGRPEVDYTVIGVQDRAQLNEALDAEKLTLPDLPVSLTTNDQNLLDPRLWKVAPT